MARNIFFATMFLMSLIAFYFALESRETVKRMKLQVDKQAEDMKDFKGRLLLETPSPYRRL
jgi:hypothetical protein